MNSLVNAGVVRILKDTTVPAYVIQNGDKFSLTKFKVIRNQECFVPCEKALLNGQVQIVYFTEGYKSFKQILPTIDGNDLLLLIVSILDAIRIVKTNGFLDRQNIDMSPEKIFVENISNKVKLIYLPVNETGIDADSFDYALKCYFKKLIESVRDKETPVLKKFYEDISMEAVRTIEDLIACADSTGNIIQEKDSPAIVEKKLILKSKDKRDSNCQFIIEKNEFTIGRKKDEVDGAIGFNKSVGRIHCRIDKDEDTFVVIDLDSRNGTFINGQRIASNQPIPLSDGDMLRLSDSEFDVEIK